MVCFPGSSTCILQTESYQAFIANKHEPCLNMHVNMAKDKPGPDHALVFK